MPKGLKGFQKGHGRYRTQESYLKAGASIGKKLAIKFKGRCLNSGKTHFKIGHRMNRGSENPMWKGGRWIDKKGYIHIYLPDHPMSRPSGYIMEHRLIMSAHIGRTLLRSEIVHHKNGNTGDNRIENLQILSQSEHSILHCLKFPPKPCAVCKVIIPRPGASRMFCSRKCANISMIKNFQRQ